RKNTSVVQLTFATQHLGEAKDVSSSADDPAGGNFTLFGQQRIERLKGFGGKKSFTAITHDDRHAPRGKALGQTERGIVHPQRTKHFGGEDLAERTFASVQAPDNFREHGMRGDGAVTHAGTGN